MITAPSGNSSIVALVVLASGCGSTAGHPNGSPQWSTTLRFQATDNGPQLVGH